MIIMDTALACGVILCMGLFVQKRRAEVKSSWLLENGGRGDLSVTKTGLKDKSPAMSEALLTDDLAHQVHSQVNFDFYRVIIIREWKEQSAQPEAKTQRFVLEIPATGERFGFVSAEAMQKALNMMML